MKNSAKHIHIFAIERHNSHFFPRDTDLNFRFHMFKIFEFVCLFSYTAGSYNYL